jgi:hypothetical protein
LTTLAVATYHQLNPSDDSLSTYGSDRDVPRPGLSNLSRPAMIALAILFSSPLGARPVQAAGCHVPERPVLKMGLSWSHESRLQAWEMAGIRPVAPPVLTHLPCPGEVPHSTIVVDVSVVAAWTPSPALEPGNPSEVTTAGDGAEARPPRPSRLDRPPR